MVCFCFLVDQRREVQRSKPAAGICSRCGGGASVADMKTATRYVAKIIKKRPWEQKWSQYTHLELNKACSVQQCTVYTCSAFLKPYAHCNLQLA
ncbi:hypothetical protein CR513_23433, partial [Mucuna pruriens]